MCICFTVLPHPCLSRSDWRNRNRLLRFALRQPTRNHATAPRVTVPSPQPLTNGIAIIAGITPCREVDCRLAILWRRVKGEKIVLTEICTRSIKLSLVTLEVRRSLGWVCAIRPLPEREGATYSVLQAGRSDKEKGSRSGSLSHGYAWLCELATRGHNQLDPIPDFSGLSRPSSLPQTPSDE